jgi:triphosphatase
VARLTANDTWQAGGESSRPKYCGDDMIHVARESIGPSRRSLPRESAVRDGIVWVTFDDLGEDAEVLAIPMVGIIPSGTAVTAWRDDRPAVIPALQPVKARSPRLVAKMSARIAFTVVALSCLAQMQGNEVPAKVGNDPEGIHQLRIGLRRFRALVAAFSDMLSVECQKILARELRWLQQELTAVRDWDVFVTTTLIPIEKRVPELQSAVAAARKLRTMAQERARAALDSPRYAGLLLRCHIWLATGGWATSDALRLDKSVGRFAAASLQRRDRHLRKFGGKRADLPDLELHSLRMIAKKQRYLCDFVGGLYPRKTTTRYMSALAKLQDCLGERNDARVARRLTAELEAYMIDVQSDAISTVARSVGIVLGWQATLHGKHSDDVSYLWKEFRACKSFWSHAVS